jgi:hypothetical protein
MWNQKCTYEGDRNWYRGDRTMRTAIYGSMIAYLWVKHFDAWKELPGGYRFVLFILFVLLMLMDKTGRR